MRTISGPWLAVLFATACGDSGAGPDNGPRSSLGEMEIASQRSACAFKAQTAAGLTVPKGAPIGTELPIDTIVIIMMENRSFDHLLSDLPAAGQPDVAVATSKLGNKDSMGKDVPFHHLSEMCFSDTAHGWKASHDQWNQGKNDGFVVTNEEGMPPDGTRAMGFYNAADLPFLYGAANTFAIADHYHCSLLGPTWPNRDYLYAASSHGHTTNELPSKPLPTVMDRLDDAGIDWRDYYTSLPGIAVTGSVPSAHLDHITTFFNEAKAGTLPPVSFVDADLAPNNQGAKDDFHPPGNAQLGDQFLDKVVSALMTSPQWGRMAIFINFDEHGGVFDHVPPPAACPPDDLPPDGTPGDFDRLGFRVPLLVISPYAKGHYVSHRVYDHTSITHFIEMRFLLPSLTARDANSDPLYDLFDFGSALFATPPMLARSKVDPDKVAECLAKFPRG